MGQQSVSNIALISIERENANSVVNDVDCTKISFGRRNVPLNPKYFLHYNESLHLLEMAGFMRRKKWLQWVLEQVQRFILEKKKLGD